MTSARALASLLVSLLPLLLAGCHGRTLRPDTSERDWVEAGRSAEIRAWPWPDHVSGEDRGRIEAALRTIFEVWGREGMEAEAALVAMDRGANAASMRVAGRLVDEMKRVVDEHGVEGYEGKSRIMVLDRILRKLDGVQERLFREEVGLDIDDPPSRALRLVRAWNWWYAEGRFLRRYEPWDPREDAMDHPESEDQPLEHGPGD